MRLSIGLVWLHVLHATTIDMCCAFTLHFAWGHFDLNSTVFVFIVVVVTTQ